MSGPTAVPATADVLLDYLRRRDRLLVRLARVNAATAQWDEWEANASLPDDLQRQITPPTLTREALDGLRRMLVEELGRLDGVTVDDG